MQETARFHVREPEPADAEAIARVQVATWQATYGSLLPSSYFDATALEQRTAMWRSVLNGLHRPPRLRVAETHGDIVGFAAAGPPIEDDDPVRDLQLYTLYLLPEHHGSGAGQLLLDAVLVGEPAQLWVAEDNPRAHSFYRRNGFMPDGTEKIFPHAPLVAVRLVR
ncbi:GNAT family N-acetyltransferase [Rhodococcus ruber]|uniref:GNAT family N-acetyltransferase n=1 Tax=Rhodococcus ruber TaxID=1830 RepID=UPI00209C533C|nr:N-acetyltransferase [Rhodococcus ruber]